jgi:NADPH:quinone reductase-like Zn-dependent oxidoreductase
MHKRTPMDNIQATMHGVWLTGHGGFDKLVVKSDIPRPTPGKGEVLIRVNAAGVNNTDINTRIGWYSKHDAASGDASWAGEAIRFPLIQGIDVCGHIEDVGEGVSAARTGERVLVEPCLWEAHGKHLDSPWFLGSECDGGFAEYVVVASRHAYRIECDLTSTELASFPCSYSTAENQLTRSKVKSGEVVLVTGASGGVGSAAVQLIQARGAQAIAVTHASKVEKLMGLGAMQAIPRDESLTAILGENRVDVVLDLVGGETWPELLQILKPGGRYAVSGAIAGPIVQLDLRTLYLKDLSFFGCTLLEASVFPNLIDHIEQGRISPLVAQTFPLEKIVKAQQAFLEKQHIGKIVLTINPAAEGPEYSNQERLDR